MSEFPQDSDNPFDAPVQALMARVGERVRTARAIHGFSRRLVSEASGVSLRYIAQLEAGQGNISIGLLQRIALAMGYHLEWFTTEVDPWDDTTMRLVDLFHHTDPETQAQVMQLLALAPPTDPKAQRICLVGLRGAGKSTLGRDASAALGLPFIELNKEIESHGDMPVAEIMALYGNEGYRKLESEAVDRVIATQDRMILAVAGGIVEESATYQRLLSRCHTIWIKANPQEHMDRVRAQGDERPMAGNPEAMEQLRGLLASREAMYARAEAQLDTSGTSKEASLTDLLTLISNHRFLS